MRHDDFDMDLPNSIIGFHRIVGPLADIKLYTRGSYDIDGFLIDLSYWNTDKGVAAYFGLLKPGESLDENPEGPQPEDYITEDEAVIVSFDEALRYCWLSHSLFILRRHHGYITIWDAQRLRHSFDAILHLQRGWTPIGKNELHLHQNSVQLSIVNACIAFRRVGIEEGLLSSKAG